MVPRKRARTSLTVALFGFVLTSASALVVSADTLKQSAELGKRTAKTSRDVDKYVAQLDKAEVALSALSGAQGKNLKKRYESFSKEVKNLEEAQKHATSDINEMQSNKEKYFSSWDESIAKISSPQLKQASVERRSKAIKDHDELTANLSDVGRELQPFMTSLHDVQTFLAADLSPANVSKASEMIRQSQVDAQALKDKIAPVQAQLKQFASEAPK
ncbi:MAG TPA: DUF2959 family protein [Terriglobales bacterium]|nr:DUF2959 family protein [Terriglobales bacterium]HXY49909.1 DUF2959 family protein [Terriglobales bacterium]